MQEKQKTNGFQSGIGFILASAGSAIGLGNLWSFPYKTAKYGGAAFVFMYLISVLLIGIVVMFCEFHIGRRSKANPITCYKKTNDRFGFLGLIAIVIPFLIVCYYSILGGYTIKYTTSSISGTSGIMQSFASNSLGVIIFTFIFILLAVLVVMGGVKKGIENASKILMPALFLILVALAIYANCLGSGVKEGLNFFLNPNFSKLGFEGVLAAMSQAFFSLSLGMGIMVSYGSYAGKEVKVGRSIGYICLFDTMVALLGGLIIFPSAFHFDSNIDATKLNGMTLMFEILPKIFTSLGGFGKVVSLFFYAMVTIAALTSVISLFEVVTQFAIQKFKIKRKIAILLVSIVCFLLSIPISISLGKAIIESGEMQIFGQNYLDFLDLIANVVLMPIGALGACLMVGYGLTKYQSKKQAFSPKLLDGTLKEEGFNLGKFQKVFAFMVKFITPVLIAVVEVFGIIDIIFPKKNGVRAYSSNGLGLVIVAVAIMAICMVIYFTLLRKCETGENADEIELEKKA